MPTVVETAVWVTIVALLYYVWYYVSAVVAYIQKARSLGKELDRFPGPSTHWLLGNLQNMSPDEAGIAFFCKMAEKYKRVYRLWMGPFKPVLIPCDAETVKAVMMHTDTKPMGVGGTYANMRSWVGDGLLVSSDSKWFRNRKLLTPAFHFGVLKPYMAIYNEAVDIFMEQLETLGRSGSQSVEIFKPVSLCTLNIISRCAFSYEADVQRDRTNAYARAIVRAGQLVIDRFFKPYLVTESMYHLTTNGREHRQVTALLHRTSSDVIAARKKNMEDNPDTEQKKRPDFLDILLLSKDDDGKGLSDAEIRDEVDTFLFEGHDTTASAISWILYELARNADHQKLCRQEVTSLLSGRPHPDITWDDLQEIPHLTLCIKEAIRLHTPVPQIGRETTRPFQLDGLTVPKGAEFVIMLFLIHWNRDIWGDDVMEFRPERFSHENMKLMDSHAYVPFSAGTRNCIGQNFAMNEIKVMVAKVLYRFDLSLDDCHHVEHRMEIVMRSPNGVKLVFTPRQ